MDQKTIVLCIAGGAVALVLLGLAWSRLRAWLTAHELRHAYQPRPLFSAHERAAYKALREMTDELGLVLFVKVRLLDLAEPKPRHRKYQLYLNKVSAKHVDFVVCNAKSEPKLVIELDDFTHDTPSRMARDEFVDTVLESCGYGVVHTRNIDRDELYPVLRRLRRGVKDNNERKNRGRECMPRHFCAFLGRIQ